MHIDSKDGTVTYSPIAAGIGRQSFANLALTTYRFQMVSLLKLATVTEEGVKFLSPHDGTPM